MIYFWYISLMFVFGFYQNQGMYLGSMLLNLLSRIEIVSGVDPTALFHMECTADHTLLVNEVLVFYATFFFTMKAELGRGQLGLIR